MIKMTFIWDELFTSLGPERTTDRWKREQRSSTPEYTLDKGWNSRGDNVLPSDSPWQKQIYRKSSALVGTLGLVYKGKREIGVVLRPVF